jgi:Rhodanese-like domain
MNILKKWFSTSIKKIGFEDIKYTVCHKEYILINTMDSQSQGCLILGTVSLSEEEVILNRFIDESDQGSAKIVIYGRNSTDSSVDRKAEQLISLGFHEVYIYSGGLFEWLLLQDIYGSTEFPTIGKCRDPIDYRGSRVLGSPPKLLGFFS